jgi:hypothetical protein
MDIREKRARILAGLYNNAEPFGMGFLHYVPGNLPPAEAWELVTRETGRPPEEGHYFDYLRGRLVKCVILADGTLRRTDLYDEAYGEGAAERVIAKALAEETSDYAAFVGA